MKPRKLEIGEVVGIFKLGTLLSGCKTANGRQFVHLTIKRCVDDLSEITGIEVKRISARRYQVIGLNSEETGYYDLSGEAEVIFDPSWYDSSVLEVMEATAFNPLMGDFAVLVVASEAHLLEAG